MKRTFALFLAVLMVFSLLPVSALADGEGETTSGPTAAAEASAQPTATPAATPTAEPKEEPAATPTAEPTEEPAATPTAEPTEEPAATPTAAPVASGTCGENLTWTLTEDGVLTISGTGAMTDYYSSSTRVPWYNKRMSIASVVIESGVTSIGDDAFGDCNSLTSITIPDGVTSIGVGTFYGCSSLTRVTISDSVTSIGGAAFYNCRSLTGITIPDGVASIDGWTFYGCSSLTSITIPDSVTSIGGGAFSGCSALTDVYYGGTEAEWNKIEIRSSNENLTGATIHYNTTKPMPEPTATPTPAPTAAPTPTPTPKPTATPTPIPAATAALTVSSVKSTQGKEVSVDIAVEGNPGLAVINFKIEYDKTRLKLTGYKDGILSDWEVGIGEGEKAVWVDENGNSGNGTVLTLNFKILDEAADGLAEITLTEIVAADAGENRIGITVTAGGVTVKTRVPGDINGDGNVDAFDLMRLKKYLAGFASSFEEYNADVNGDGTVDAIDLLRLKRYLAGAAVELK